MEDRLSRAGSISFPLRALASCKGSEGCPSTGIRGRENRRAGAREMGNAEKEVVRCGCRIPTGC